MRNGRTRKPPPKAVSRKRGSGDGKTARRAKAPVAGRRARKAAPRVRQVTAPKPAEVKVTPAKGRPMLVWVGKRPLSRVTAFPSQHIETFDPTGAFGRRPERADLWKDWPAGYPKGGLLFHGDNKEVLAHLLANGFRGKVNLIYIDPPFDSGADYVRKVSLRSPKGTAKIEGETYTLGEQIQYEDIWANDNYLQFMYERLLILRELLAEDGSIYLHCDYRKVHLLRCLMDEVFGPERLQNEIVWFYPRGGDSERQFNRKHDTILFYSKGEAWTFNYLDTLIPYTAEQLARFDQEDEKGRYYWNVNPRGERGKTYLRKEGIGEYDVWTMGINAAQVQQYGYPTLKPQALLERIVRASSSIGDVILDSFIGSGTTAAVAQKLGRRWIGCDINKGAIQTTSKRLQTIIFEKIAQREKGRKVGVQRKLLDTEGDEKEAPEPAQLAFTVWRINDYDLEIQHNEAVNLACEHIGIERTRTDRFFDGVLGKSLVKIVPFNHPLSPLDLEELSKELEARPDEDRSITLVCLGMELAARKWIEDWNRLRRGSEAVNRIAIIELRTDPKYGRFIRHEGARAKVRIERKGDRVRVIIDDFISPSIIERLREQTGILSPKIDDWRAMVDCVMIDPAYDGKVFNVAVSDVPEKKTDLVKGVYELTAASGPTTVAVKIINMLGEEVLVLEEPA